jgi:hypothetical protein
MMIRERALKVVMAVVGLFFLGAVLPVVGGILHPDQSDTGDTMMSLYATLGVFLLLAVRNPSAYRSFITFTAWSNFAHAVVMSVLGLKMPALRAGFLIGSTMLVVIGVALLALTPPRQSPTVAPIASV